MKHHHLTTPTGRALGRHLARLTVGGVGSLIAHLRLLALASTEEACPALDAALEASAPLDAAGAPPPAAGEREG